MAQNAIKFEYEGTTYILEYDRASAMKAEEMYDISMQGISKGHIAAMDGLLKGAFIKHHPNMREDVKEKFVNSFANKKDMYPILIQGYGECVTSLFEDGTDAKNAIKWETM